MLPKQLTLQRDRTETGITLDSHTPYSLLYNSCLDAGLTLKINVEPLGTFPTPFRITHWAEEPYDSLLGPETDEKEEVKAEKPLPQCVLRQDIEILDPNDHETTHSILEDRISNFDWTNEELTLTDQLAIITRPQRNTLPTLIDELTVSQIDAVLYACFAYDAKTLERVKRILITSDEQSSTYKKGIYQTSRLVTIASREEVLIPVVEAVTRILFPAELKMPPRLTYLEVRGLKEALGGEVKPLKPNWLYRTYESEELVNYFADDTTIPGNYHTVRKKIVELFVLSSPGPPSIQQLLLGRDTDREEAF